MGHQNPPAVSVVIPVYNAAAHLAEAVDSVLRQSWTDWELIAVDDGSTDDSVRILQEYAAEESRIHLVRRSHAGIAATRNAATDAARGEFIAALDNDDIMMPSRLKEQVEFLRMHPEHVAVGAAVLNIDVDGDPIDERRFPMTHEEIETELLAGRNPMIQSVVMFRREAMNSVQGYHDRCNFAEDYDLFLRLSEIGQLANMENVLLRQRQHVSRASASHFRDQHRVARLTLEEAYQRRGLQGDVPQIEEPWHPTVHSDYHSRCASDAWDAGNIPAVRKHAVRLWQQSGFSLRAIELYSRTLMGRQLYGLFSGIKAIGRPLKKLFRSRAS